MILNMWAKQFILVIVQYIMVRSVKGQPPFEQGNVDYPDLSQADEVYDLDQGEYGQDESESMRALAGLTIDNDVTTHSYQDRRRIDIPDITNYSNNTGPEFMNHNQNSEEIDPTSASKESINPEYKDSTNKYFDSLKEIDFPKDSRDEIPTKQPNSSVLRNITSTKHYSVEDRPTEKENHDNIIPNSNKDTIRYSNMTSSKDSFQGMPYTGLDDRSTLQSNLGSGYNKTSSDVSSSNTSICDPATHSGCDVLHYERCNPETRQCRCLNGYMRENAATGAGSCRAVSFYHGHITFGAPRPSQKYSEEELLPFKQRLLNLIGLSLKRPTLNGVLKLDVGSVEVEGQQMSFTFELGLDKSVLLESQDIQKALAQDLAVTSRDDAAPEQITLKGSNNSTSKLSALLEVNPCINKDHNHCSQLASCRYSKGTVTCDCISGYEDLAPTLYRLPGEVCIEKCRCHNGGLCVDADTATGTKQCTCLNWYFGSECQIDGKELLLICCCSIGSLVVLCLAMCCCYYGCIRHKDNTAGGPSMFPFSPDINVLKLPRVWMDTASYDDHELSPPNPRRLSVASERSPYLEGYIMEDIPVGTLQRHGDGQSSYFQVSQTSLGHCPATTSSHSFYRY